MSADLRLCARHDLRAVVPQWNRWSVDDQGCPLDQTDAGEPDDDVEEYVCDNCGLYFPPDGHSRAAFDVAWEEALGHLQAHQNREAHA